MHYIYLPHRLLLSPFPFSLTRKKPQGWVEKTQNPSIKMKRLLTTSISDSDTRRYSFPPNSRSRIISIYENTLCLFFSVWLNHSHQFHYIGKKNVLISSPFYFRFILHFLNFTIQSQLINTSCIFENILQNNQLIFFSFLFLNQKKKFSRRKVGLNSKTQTKWDDKKHTLKIV